MTLFGSCLPPYDFAKKPISADSLAAAADVFTGNVNSAFKVTDLPDHAKPILRMTGGLWQMFPSATTTSFDIVDDAYEKARATGWRIYFDPVNPGAWATGGKAAYVCEVLGSSCQILAEWGVPRGLWAQIYEVAGKFLHVPDLRDDLTQPDYSIRDILAGVFALTNTPENIAWHFVSEYRKELSCALAWNIPEAFGDQSKGGTHVWGDPAHVEADKLSAPRPWLLSANIGGIGPNMKEPDTDAMEYMGEQIGRRYPDAVMHGLGNEWDIPLSYPYMPFDAVNTPGGPDLVRTQILPKWYAPYFRGLLRGIQAVTLGGRVPMLAGPEVAYPGTLARFINSDLMDAVVQFDIPTVHAYADPRRWPRASYDDLRVYAAYFKSIRRRLWGIGEIDGQPVAAPGIAAEGFVSIVDWTRAVLRDLKLDPAPEFIIYNVNERFVKGFNDGGTELSPTGIAMRDLIGGFVGRRRAVRG